MRAIGIIVCTLVSLTLFGCASRPINEPIEQVDPTSGYRPHLRIGSIDKNDPQTLFVLSFSGGGTRAAAFSYGVLEELRRTEIVHEGQSRRLLDEVDVITGVSGGSFTALAFALYGDRLFSEYENRFLKRDVQGELISRALNPFYWNKYIGGSAGRSELAAEYYDEILFEGATFGDLVARPGPVAIATSTDLSTGSRLAFYQNDFDLLCSDLEKVPLSRAAAASSAVPIVLSPVTLNNYGGNCDYEYPLWVKDVADPKGANRPAGRAIQRFKQMRAFQNSEDRPYIHLVDGGVSDNIGVRGVLEALEELGASVAFQGEVGFAKKIRRMVVMIVNSHSSPSTDWDRKEKPPGLAVQFLQSTGVPIDSYSFETVETMKDISEIWKWRRELLIAQARLAGATEAEAKKRIPQFDLDVIDISFDAIEEADVRKRFMNLPTSFVLKPEEVDELREVAGRLMRKSGLLDAVTRDLDE